MHIASERTGDFVHGVFGAILPGSKCLHWGGALLIVVLVGGGLFSLSAQAQTTPPIRPQSASVQEAGSSFWIEVEVGSGQAPVENLFGVGFSLTYDTSRVDVIEDEAGPFLGSGLLYTSNVDSTTGEVAVGVSRKSGGGVDGVGVVARVKVQIKSDVPEGDTLTFRLADVSANDPDGNTITLDPEPRRVTVGRAVPIQSAVQALSSGSDGTVKPGDTVLVDVNVGTSEIPVSDLFGTSFTLTYDAAHVTVLRAAPGPFLGSDPLFNSNVDAGKGEIEVGVTRKSGTGGVDGTGSVARVRARIDPDAGGGTPLTFGVREAQARNPSDSSIALTTSDDVITTDVQFPLDVQPPSAPPEIETAPTLTAQIPSDFDPKAGTLFYRKAGVSSFARKDFPVEEGAEEAQVEVPKSAVTERGVDYVLRLAKPTSGGDTLRATHPSEMPFQNPAHLRVSVPEIGAEGAFRAETYRMVSVPLTLGDQSVFDVLKAQYGAYDPAAWRLFRWSPENSTYREGSEVKGTLGPGRAAWLITREGDPLSVEEGTSVPADTAHALSLPPGWNQVGSPFAFSVAWSEVAGSGQVRAPVTYDGTASQGERFQFDQGRLRPWRGAFVYNPQDTAVTLRVPPVETESGAAAATKNRPLASVEGDGYRLQAIASARVGDKRLRDRQTWMGLREGAVAGVGPEDRPKPPGVGPSARVTIVPEEGPGLARSLKPLTEASDGADEKQGASWDLSVTASTETASRRDQTVTVRLAEEGRRPSRFGRWVVDLDRGKRLPVTHGTVEVSVREGEARRLQVIVGTEAFAETASEDISLSVPETELGVNAPNPFSRETRIVYQLAEAEEVRLAVYDVLGRRVRTLVEGKKKAGVHRVTLRADPLASGVYFYRIEAGDFTKTRKMVLVR